MGGKFNLSNDGTIFSVNADGSITKVAHINDDGTISGTKERKQNKHNVVGYWIFIVLLLALVTFLGYMYYEEKSSRDYWSSLYWEQRREIEKIKKEKSSTQTELSDFKSFVANSFPLIITDIEIGNSYRDGTLETKYGGSIYSSLTMFLKPRIKYYGIESGRKQLKVKWIMPDGTLSTGSSSPNGYSYIEDYYINVGKGKELELSGWGGDIKGHWKSGRYKIEIWFGDICLKSKSFYIN